MQFLDDAYVLFVRLPKNGRGAQTKSKTSR